MTTGLLRFKYGCAALLCFAALLSSSSAKAVDAVDCPAKAWSVGLYEHGLLFFHGRSGIDKDIVDEIRKRTGCKLYSSLMPRARIWYDLEQGKLDLSVSGMASAKRRRFAWFIPYMQMKSMVVLAPSVPLSVVQAADFLKRSNLIFGAVRSFQHGQLNDELLQQLANLGRLQYYPDSRTLFKALKQERVHAIFAQVPAYRHFIPELQLSSKIRILDWALQEEGLQHGLVLAKSSFTEQQMEQWHALMQQMKQDGTLHRIFTRYLSEQEALALEVH